MCRNKINLKLAMRRNQTLSFQLGEHRIRSHGDIAIEDIVKLDGLYRDAGLEPIAAIATLQGSMKLKCLLRRFEGGMIGEDRFEPCNPVESFAGFSVGDAFEICPSSWLITVNTSRASDRGTLPTK